MKKNNPQNTTLTIGVLLFIFFIVALIHYFNPFIGNSNQAETDYSKIIDSLSRENEKLDSLYDIESNKKSEVRTLYKKVSIKEEIDSLSKLKTDLNNLKNNKEVLSDSLNPDSLRLILMKEFN